MKYRKAVLLLGLSLLIAPPLVGVDTTFWQVGTFDDFLQGTLQGVSLAKEGQVRLAPEPQTVFNPDEALALSMNSDLEGNLYIGTGHQGRVFRVDKNLKGSLFFTAQEPDIFALATGPDGALYVGSSPEGKIYRVTPEGKSSIFFDPKTKYIWALLFDSRGKLYAATGDRGLIFRIDADGKGKLFFDSKQTHVMCLALDPSDNLLAGSVPNGLIYRIIPEGKAFVLYKADLPEIHDLAVDGDGRIFAAALGGGPGKSVPAIFGPQTPTPLPAAGVTTVTVTAQSEEVDKAQKPPIGNTTPAASFNRPAPSPVGFTVPQLLEGRGSLIEISPDNTVETLWSSKKESIFGLALRGRQVLFTTDEDGRLFELNRAEDGQNLTLLTETHEALATRLMFKGPTLYIATSNIAKLMRLGGETGREGTYESSVKDAKFISRWGVLAWRGELGEGGSLQFYTRSGNSDRPDSTWSDWAGPEQDPEGSPIKSPPARYIQWKAVFRSTSDASPVLDDVTLSYLNQNLPPEIRSFNVSTGGERTGPAGLSSISPPGIAPGSSMTISAGAPPGISLTPSALGKPQPTPTVLSWQADDPNGDTLVYSLYVKGADENEWHLLKDKLHQTQYILDAGELPDGKYTARLVASDQQANPPSLARQTELLSAPFWIDNTPPEVQVLNQKVVGDGAEVHFKAQDAISPLRAAELSIDGNDWQNLTSDDGIVDSRTETFTVRTGKLAPGEHLIVLRAFDTAGNAGLGKAVVHIPGPGGPKR